MRALTLWVVLFLMAMPANAATLKPYFMSLKSNEVNVRTGPNVRYPILFVLTKRHLPIEVVAEFEQWRKVKDSFGDEGWIHRSLLSKKRFSIIQAKEPVLMHRFADERSRPLYRLESGVVARTKRCEAFWCEVSVNGTDGWVEKSHLYGVYTKEQFD